MNETTVLAGIVAAIVTVLTKVIDALVTRRRDKNSGSLEHRKLLSDDERAFRQSVLDEVKGLREELEKRAEQIEAMRVRVAEARQLQVDAERKNVEADHRALLLETQVTDLRALHQKVLEGKHRAKPAAT